MLGQFLYPNNLAPDARGNVCMADTGNHRIVKLDPKGKAIEAFGEHGTRPCQFNLPADVAVDREGNIYVADTRNQRIQKFTDAWRFLWERVLGAKSQQYTPFLGRTKPSRLRVETHQNASPGCAACERRQPTPALDSIAKHRLGMDPSLRPLWLSEKEKQTLRSFLEALRGTLDVRK